MNKIIAFKDLPILLTNLKPQKTVLVGGCFDILHLGHVRFLTQAKQYGTLLVALESDETLIKFKGKSRPIHRQNERAEVLAALEVVDYVILLPYFSSNQEYFDLIKQIKPALVAITEGDPQTSNKQAQVENVGGKLITIPKITTPSTTQLAKLLHLD